MTERIDTVVVGGGQAGLQLAITSLRRTFPLSFSMPESKSVTPGETDGTRYARSSPARYSGLPGLAFRASGDYYPTKDKMADYLVTYADEFDVPVPTGVRVDSLSRQGRRFVLEAEGQTFEAENVVVAMATHQKPWIPSFSSQLGEGITELHTATYRSPSQLPDGPLLVVGAGNSGAEVSLDVAPHYETCRGTIPAMCRLTLRAGWLSGS